MKQDATTITRAFVDAIEDHTARLLVSRRTVNVPVDLLPPDVAEGSWVEIRVKQVPAPTTSAATEAERRKLSQDDDGGDIKL